MPGSQPDFQKLIEFIRDEVNRDLTNLPIPDKPAYFYDPIRYSLCATGKRFRPILVHLVGRTLKADPDSLMKMALAVELLHNFTLIHDDIMDNDAIRHGQPTIHSKWDASKAILAGDGIFTMAQLLLSCIPDRANEVFGIFNQACLEVCEGQALDKEFENDLSIADEQYLDMIEKKTGALLGACAALPAILTNAGKETAENFDQFGRALGKGFQIHDDLLEIYADPEDMGKSLGSDIAEGKQTMMVILARNEFGQEWEKITSDPDPETLMKRIRDFFSKTDIENKTRSMAKLYFDKARDSLHKIETIDREELLKFVHLVEKRTY